MISPVFFFPKKGKGAKSYFLFYFDQDNSKPEWSLCNWEGGGGEVGGIFAFMFPLRPRRRESLSRFRSVEKQRDRGSVK